MAFFETDRTHNTKLAYAQFEILRFDSLKTDRSRCNKSVRSFFQTSLYETSLYELLKTDRTLAGRGGAARGVCGCCYYYHYYYNYNSFMFWCFSLYWWLFLRLIPTPNLPTKNLPTKIAWLKLSGKFPLDMRIPPLKIKIMLESNPPKSRILVRRLTAPRFHRGARKK